MQWVDNPPGSLEQEVRHQEPARLRGRRRHIESFADQKKKEVVCEVRAESINSSFMGYEEQTG